MTIANRATPMTQPHAMRKFHFLIAGLVVVVDLASKWLVAQHITLHDSLTVIPGFFRLTHVENRGAAFGLFSDSPSEWKVAALILFSLIALVVVSALLWKNSHALTVTGFGLALILGGALGNLWDRVLDGHVVDFLDFSAGRVSLAGIQRRRQRHRHGSAAAGHRDPVLQARRREEARAGKTKLKFAIFDLGVILSERARPFGFAQGKLWRASRRTPTRKMSHKRGASTRAGKIGPHSLSMTAQWVTTVNRSNHPRCCRPDSWPRPHRAHASSVPCL